MRLYDIDAGDLFGDRVFDLNPWIYLDKIKLAVVHIHQEFDRTGTFIVNMCTDFAAQFANLGALFFGKIGGRRAFDDLLVATLNGTISFK